MIKKGRSCSGVACLLLLLNSVIDVKMVPGFCEAKGNTIDICGLAVAK